MSELLTYHIWVIEIKDSNTKENTCLIRSAGIKCVLGQEPFRKSSLTLFYAVGGIPGHLSEKVGTSWWMDYLCVRSCNVYIYLSSKPKSVHLTSVFPPNWSHIRMVWGTFKKHRFPRQGEAPERWHLNATPGQANLVWPVPHCSEDLCWEVPLQTPFWLSRRNRMPCGIQSISLPLLTSFGFKNTGFRLKNMSMKSLVHEAML